MCGRLGGRTQLKFKTHHRLGSTSAIGKATREKLPVDNFISSKHPFGGHSRLSKLLNTLFSPSFLNPEVCQEVHAEFTTFIRVGRVYLL